MISRELAEALKKAGLPWEPKQGDWFVAWEPPSREHNGHYIDELEIVLEPDWYIVKYMAQDIWLPSLSGLLAEIEARGYRWWMSKTMPMTDLATIGVSLYSAEELKRNTDKDTQCKHFESGSTPEEAAGEALLWVLEREGKA